MFENNSVSWEISFVWEGSRDNFTFFFYLIKTFLMGIINSKVMLHTDLIYFIHLRIHKGLVSL